MYLRDTHEQLFDIDQSLLSCGLVNFDYSLSRQNCFVPVSSTGGRDSLQLHYGECSCKTELSHSPLPLREKRRDKSANA
jgi:hypothetical protein